MRLGGGWAVPFRLSGGVLDIFMVGWMDGSVGLVETARKRFKQTSVCILHNSGDGCSRGSRKINEKRPLGLGASPNAFGALSAIKGCKLFYTWLPLFGAAAARRSNALRWRR